MTVHAETVSGPVEALVAAIERRTGLNLAGSRRPGAAAGLARAMAAAGVGDHDAYRRLIERDRVAFDDLIAELTVGETYFLRERPQLALLRRDVLPDVVERRGPRHVVEAWSAGCATGEEAYTLAMVLEEEGLGRRSRVVGTDLSPAAVARAEAGVYGPWSLRGMSAEERDAWLEPVGRRFRVTGRLARRVRFATRNLLDGPPPGSAPFDVVFCRNVLIYLVPAAIEQVTRALLESLAPGGWLVTAASDPPLHADGLERVRTPQGIAYRRAGEDSAPFTASGHITQGTPRVPVAPPAARPPQPRPRPRPAAVPGDPLAAARLAFGENRYLEAAHLAAEAVAGGGGTDAHALLVRALANGARAEEALSAARAAVAAHPIEAELHYLLAVLEAEQRRFAEASTAAAVALYLQPGLAVAHLLKARAARALGDEATAQRSLRNARRLLEALPADEPVPLADGEPARLLLASIDAHQAGAGRSRTGAR